MSYEFMIITKKKSLILLKYLPKTCVKYKNHWTISQNIGTAHDNNLSLYIRIKISN